MLSRPIPEASERRRGLARIGATHRVAFVVHRGSASAPILLPLVAQPRIVLDAVAPGAGFANRPLRLLRRRRTGKTFPGVRLGESRLRIGERGIGVGRGGGANAPIVRPLVTPQRIVPAVV